MKNPPESESAVLAYIGLGSNLGDRQAILESALRALDALPQTRLVRVSSWHENPAVGIPDGNDFLNGVAEIKTALSPHELLHHLLRIESDHGRVRSGESDPEVYQNRTLDLDLLLFGDLQVSDAELTLPHPRMWDRPFVTGPLQELMPIPQR